jgi:hypothetical protein
MLVLVSV